MNKCTSHHNTCDQSTSRSHPTADANGPSKTRTPTRTHRGHHGSIGGSVREHLTTSCSSTSPLHIKMIYTYTGIGEEANTTRGGEGLPSSRTPALFTEARAPTEARIWI